MRLTLSTAIVVSALAMAMVAPASMSQDKPEADPWAWIHAIPVPSGLFNSWTGDDQKSVTRRVTMSCTLTPGDMFSNYQGPNEAVEHGLRYIAATCTYRAMPSDWPYREHAKQVATEEYERARKLDPSLPNPDLPP
jgi:hypothetical protein